MNFEDVEGVDDLIDKLRSLGKKPSSKELTRFYAGVKFFGDVTHHEQDFEEKYVKFLCDEQFLTVINWFSRKYAFPRIHKPNHDPKKYYKLLKTQKKFKESIPHKERKIFGKKMDDFYSEFF